MEMEKKGGHTKLTLRLRSVPTRKGDDCTVRLAYHAELVLTKMMNSEALMMQLAPDVNLSSVSERCV